MDIEQTEKWLAQQYKYGDQFELVAVKDKQARRKTFTYGEDDVTAACGKFEELGYDVYASAIPTNVQELGHYDRIWVDQDDLAGPWPWGTEPELQWPNPTTLVKTSEEGGSFRWQAIWRLTEPLSPDEGRATMKRLAGKIGADQSVHDMRRILRVPGITNAKRGVMARYLGGSHEPVSMGAFNLPKETAVQALLSQTVTKPQAILGEWLEGFGEGERNQKAYICARFLHSCEVAHDDALAIVALGGSRCTPPMDDQEIYNAVRSAYHAGR